MVCIAAFIILGIVVLALPIIRLFSKKTSDSIWRLFKKALHCFTRRVTLRTCDTSFKDDVKHSLLRRVVLKHPRWVKPLSAAIEVGSVLIILVTVWSILVGAKALVSLYVYGTCNTNNPSACSLDSSEACSIDAAPISFTAHPVQWVGDWFGDFGTAIAAIPTRMTHWEATDYLPEHSVYYNHLDKDKETAIDIFDPGCVICNRSFKAQLSSGFFDKYNVTLIVYPIKDTTTASGYKFNNSYVVSSYMVATSLKPLDESVGAEHPAAWQIAERMYTGKDADGNGYQNAFNLGYSHDKAREVLQKWLNDFGYSEDEVKEIAALAESDQVKQLIDKNYDLVDKQIKTKKIPTAIYNGQRHDGEFKE